MSNLAQTLLSKITTDAERNAFIHKYGVDTWNAIQREAGPHGPIPGTDRSVISRENFEALPTADKWEYIRAGGTVV